MELFRQLDDKQTNKRTDGLTELFLKSLSRLKKFNDGCVGGMLQIQSQLQFQTVFEIDGDSYDLGDIWRWLGKGLDWSLTINSLNLKILTFAKFYFVFQSSQLCYFLCLKLVMPLPNSAVVEQKNSERWLFNLFGLRCNPLCLI